MAYGKMSKGKTGMKKSGGLTKKQKTLPPALQKKILAARKGKKNENKEKGA